MLSVELYFVFLHLISFCGFQTGKPRGRQPKVPKHTMDSGGVINISDDSSSDSDGMDTDSNSSPDSLLDNDDVIFVNHTSCQTGRERSLSLVCVVSRNAISTLAVPINIIIIIINRCMSRQWNNLPCPVVFVTLAYRGYMVNVSSAFYSQPG